MSFITQDQYEKRTAPIQQQKNAENVFTRLDWLFLL